MNAITKLLGLGVTGLLLVQAATATIDKTLKFSKPTNRQDAHVRITINPGPDVRVLIPSGTTAEGKRDLIDAALRAEGYDVATDGPGGSGLTIRHLANGTRVKFTPGTTGERRDDVLSTVAVQGTIAFEGLFDPIDQEFGTPAVFTAGIVTDVGELVAQVSASELNFQTDGPIICQALFQRLAPRAPQFGAQINFAGDRLEVYFDPAYTVTQGGILFGTTSPSPGCYGETLSGEGPDEPTCGEDIDGDGIVGLSDLSRVLAGFGTSVDMPGFDSAADVNRDGQIDLSDLSRILSVFGGYCLD